MADEGESKIKKKRSFRRSLRRLSGRRKNRHLSAASDQDKGSAPSSPLSSQAPDNDINGDATPKDSPSQTDSNRLSPVSAERGGRKKSSFRHRLRRSLRLKGKSKSEAAAASSHSLNIPKRAGSGHSLNTPAATKTGPEFIKSLEHEFGWICKETKEECVLSTVDVNSLDTVELHGLQQYAVHRLEDFVPNRVPSLEDLAGDPNPPRKRLSSLTSSLAKVFSRSKAELPINALDPQNVNSQGGIQSRTSSSASSSLATPHRDSITSTSAEDVSSSPSLSPQRRRASSGGGNASPSGRRRNSLSRKATRSSSGDSPRVFGRTLSQLLEDDRTRTNDPSLRVPVVFSSTVDYLEQNGLSTQGIFRVSGSAKRIRQLNESFEAGLIPDFEAVTPNDVAAVLKYFFRQLPSPLLPTVLHPCFLSVLDLTSIDDRLTVLRLLCLLLPEVNRRILKRLLALLAAVAKSSTEPEGNMMTSHNLALIFAPNILRPAPPDKKKQITASSGSISSTPDKNSGFDAADSALINREGDACDVFEMMIDNSERLFMVPASCRDSAISFHQTRSPEASAAIIRAIMSHETLDETAVAVPAVPLPPSSKSVASSLLGHDLSRGSTATPSAAGSSIHVQARTNAAKHTAHRTSQLSQCTSSSTASRPESVQNDVFSEPDAEDAGEWALLKELEEAWDQAAARALPAAGPLLPDKKKHASSTSQADEDRAVSSPEASAATEAVSRDTAATGAHSGPPSPNKAFAAKHNALLSGRAPSGPSTGTKSLTRALLMKHSAGTALVGSARSSVSDASNSTVKAAAASPASPAYKSPTARKVGEQQVRTVGRIMSLDEHDYDFDSSDGTKGTMV